MACCSTRRRRLCRGLPATRVGWVGDSASPWCCTPGRRPSSIIRMCMAGQRRGVGDRWPLASSQARLSLSGAGTLAGLSRQVSRCLAALRGLGDLHLPQALTDAAAWTRLLTQLRQTPWVVYLKPPLSGPEQVLEYLARYTHRVALSNERLLSANTEKSAFAIAIRRAAISRVMRLTHESFCAASCCMCCRTASSASATTASPPIATRTNWHAACRAATRCTRASTAIAQRIASRLPFRVTGRDPTLLPPLLARYLLLIVPRCPKARRLPELHATGPPAIHEPPCSSYRALVWSQDTSVRHRRARHLTIEPLCSSVPSFEPSHFQGSNPLMLPADPMRLAFTVQTLAALSALVTIHFP